MRKLVMILVVILSFAIPFAAYSQEMAFSIETKKGSCCDSSWTTEVLPDGKVKDVFVTCSIEKETSGWGISACIVTGKQIGRAHV